MCRDGSARIKMAPDRPRWHSHLWGLAHHLDHFSGRHPFPESRYRQGGASPNGLWIVDVVRVVTRLDGGRGGFCFLLWFVPFWLGVGVDSAFVVLVGPRLGWFNTRCAYTHSASDRSKLCSVEPPRLPRHSSAVRLTLCPLCNDVPKNRAFSERCAQLATLCPSSNDVPGNNVSFVPHR